VLDPIFGPTATAASKALRPGGRLVNLGSARADTPLLLPAASVASMV